MVPASTLPASLVLLTMLARRMLATLLLGCAIELTQSVMMEVLVPMTRVILPVVVFIPRRFALIPICALQILAT